MNATIYENINSSIKEDDILYFLGDWSFGGKDKVPIVRENIRCKNIHFVAGNHDHHIERDRNLQKLFLSVRKELFTKICGRDFFLSHYAHRTYIHQSATSIHLYGHSHGSLPDDIHSLSMDIGFDTELFGHKIYTPYHIDEIFHIMDNIKEPVSIDHHTS